MVLAPRMTRGYGHVVCSFLKLLMGQGNKMQPFLSKKDLKEDKQAVP